MAESQKKVEEVRSDLNSLSSRFDSLQSEVSELKDSNKRALDNLLPKVEALLANQSLPVSSSVVVEGPAANAESAVSLIEAAEDGDIEAIFRLLSTDDIDFKQRTEDGDSALHVAARAGFERAVIVLLGNIPVDIPGHLGRTALHCASAEGHVTVVRTLIKAGANVDVKDGVGDSPILTAARAGHLHIAELLVNHNASLNTVDKSGNPAIVVAAKLNHWEIVKLLLLRGASPEIYKGDDNAPLYLIAKEKKYSLLTSMLQKVEHKEEQICITLTKCNDTKLVRVLEDAAPGFCRKRKEIDAMTQLAGDGKVDVLRTMLDRGADVNRRNSKSGTSCLINAAFRGQVHVMKLFLERGASVDLIHLKQGRTALHFAAEREHVECVRLLLDAGASVEIECNQSRM